MNIQYMCLKTSQFNFYICNKLGAFFSLGNSLTPMFFFMTPTDYSQSWHYITCEEPCSASRATTHGCGKVGNNQQFDAANTSERRTVARILIAPKSRS